MMITEEKIIKIEGQAHSLAGASFPCHETLDYRDDGEGHETAKTTHCAGALIYSEKHDTPTQIMRIAERLGMYNRTKLGSFDLVWDDLDEWLENGSCE